MGGSPQRQVRRKIENFAMTEADWLTCSDPKLMLEFLLPKASDRKLRLFACALCRRIWRLLLDKRSRKAVAVSENYADGIVSKKELRRAGHAAWQAACKSQAGEGDRADSKLQDWAWGAVRVACEENHEALRNCILFPVTSVLEIVSYEGAFDPGLLLRDIFGNPFQSLLVNPTWLSPQLVEFAHGIYDERTFDRLPMLADALEEAGCNKASILDHCRGPGPHVRGCWVVDVILGKQ
jgi:hypothetical protein